MASTKRHFPDDDEEEKVIAPTKKAKESESESLSSPRVVLNPADCDLGIQFNFPSFPFFALTHSLHRSLFN